MYIYILYMFCGSLRTEKCPSSHCIRSKFNPSNRSAYTFPFLSREWSLSLWWPYPIYRLCKFSFYKYGQFQFLSVYIEKKQSWEILLYPLSLRIWLWLVVPVVPWLAFCFQLMLLCFQKKYKFNYSYNKAIVKLKLSLRSVLKSFSSFSQASL